MTLPSLKVFFSFIPGQIFHSLIVSSAATLANGAIVRAGGEQVTLLVWPVKVCHLGHAGYRHTVSWLWLSHAPSTSLYSEFQAMLDTWLPVSKLCNWVMVVGVPDPDGPVHGASPCGGQHPACQGTPGHSLDS